MPASCESCTSTDAKLTKLRAENDELKAQLQELNKLCTLQAADLERYRVACLKQRPNEPEHAPREQLQLVFEHVVASLAAPANDATSADANETDGEGAAPAPPAPTTPEDPPKKKRKGHGRRGRVDFANLPVEPVVVHPPEVLAAGGAGYVRIGEETSDRIAYRPASHFVLRIVTTKWVRLEPARSRAIIAAEVPPSVWPRTMADPSLIVQIMLAKYDLLMPLHRQERASPRHGFYLPRSTQCGWLGEAYEYVYRIVAAMMRDACATAHCIATDATGAPVRQHGKCASWHLFVFLADRDHVIFQPVREHTNASIATLLDGFSGALLSDAASIYDALHRERGLLAVYCWAHVRRYFWYCRETDRVLADEALAILSRLFQVERETRDLPMPERTAERAARASPVLDLFDAWIARTRPSATPRTPLAAALTYYDNQREGLRRFLDDGWLRIDNNLSEQQLRHGVLGRRNWTFFENPNGLRWYAVFRSLIASCALHGIEPQEYLEEILRLSPHWSTTRMLELSPKHWATTRAALTDDEREIIRRPWEAPKTVAADVVDAVA